MGKKNLKRECRNYLKPKSNSGFHFLREMFRMDSTSSVDNIIFCQISKFKYSRLSKTDFAFQAFINVDAIQRVIWVCLVGGHLISSSNFLWKWQNYLFQ